MFLKRGWILAVSAVAVAVSLSSASANQPSDCQQQVDECMLATVNEEDAYVRRMMEQQCIMAYEACMGY
ncbi:MAG TPA: hypothetical protein VE153_26530 [Myxococcus sp.]|nr:hypothetical protein [Myxococcus sp.]